MINNPILENDFYKSPFKSKRGNLGKAIPGFDEYTITESGTVYNIRGQAIAETNFNNARYVRVSKNGKRYTLSINRVLFQVYSVEGLEIPLNEGELAFRYKDTSYVITSCCRVYNLKFRRWVNVVYRNGYPTVNISNNGRVEAISIIKFLKSKGGVING